jgi:hypothetical protein
LVLDIWTRFNNSLEYNKNYTFSVRTWIATNALREPQNTSFNVSFAPPWPYEDNVAMKPTNCEALNLYSLMFWYRNDEMPRVVTFNRGNYSQIFVGIDARIDNGSTAARSPCNVGNVTS